MGVIVQKYGGTSVGSIERIRAVAERVRRTRQEGHQVVVVVSAMAGETDRLLGLARAVSATPVAREVDMLLATGEMVSIALVAMTLQELGCQAESFTGPQGGILTDNVHTRARIKHITTARLRRALVAGNVPVVVKSSFSEGSGTLVTRPDQDMEQVIVAGVTADKNQAKITLTRVPDRPGIAAKLFGRIAAADIVVDMIIQNSSEGGLTDISFTVSRSDAQQTLALARQSLADLGAEEATLQTNIAKVSIVGVGMQSHAGVAARMFEVLAAESINILMISTSEIKISCVIEDKYTELAVRVLHDAFQLDQGER